jgi:hypothetical protein
VVAGASPSGVMASSTEASIPHAARLRVSPMLAPVLRRGGGITVAPRTPAAPAAAKLLLRGGAPLLLRRPAGVRVLVVA